MNVAFGFKAHSGWAALVVLGAGGGEPVVVDRRRIELVDDRDAEWAGQPYHAADGLPRPAARDMVTRGIEAARQLASREMRAAVNRARHAGHEVAACAVLVGNPLPDWTIEEILAVHFRMHAAEGALFRDVLRRAAAGCGLQVVTIPEKQLANHAEAALATPLSRLAKTLTTLGKAVGPPWGKDQKDATLAAMIALQKYGDG